MTDDIAAALDNRPSSRHASIRDELLEIQNYKNKDDKSARWAANTECLSLDPAGSNTLILAKKHEGSRYVAVSHAWAYSLKPEGCVGGLFAVQKPGYCPQSSKTRDEVLERIIRYTRHHRLRQFWIDIECINQEDQEEHQIAMDSMDLVYSYSTHPLGLLGTILQTQKEVDLLQSLLEGAFTREARRSGHPTLEDWFGEQQVSDVLQLLTRLSSDHWWHRRWIFQEEYRSSDKMILMVRHREGIKKREKFGILECELCFSPIAFRASTTRFLLACGKRQVSGWQAECVRLLKVFGRYNILYHYSRPARSKAMSTIILSDIARRKSRDAFDVLPIIENTCDYPHRLASKALFSKNFSLSMCILALHVLNGEIVKDNGESLSPVRCMNVVDYLDSIALDSFRPPVDGYHLSYIKKARLQNVTLTARGMCTQGHVWEICDEFSVPGQPVCLSAATRMYEGQFGQFEQERLYSLVDTLRSMGWLYLELAEKLAKFTERMSEAEELGASSKQMCLMAKTIAKALSSGGKVSTARLIGTTIPGAIFVGVTREAQNVFTSWHHRTRSHGRVQHSWVSLEVNVSCKNNRPELRTLQWVNGIAFFSQREKVQVIFRWPTTWTAHL